MIAERVRQIAVAHPAAIAVIDGDRTLSYPDLLEAAGRIRERLEASGVAARAIVMMSLGPCWEAVAAFVACADLGAVFTPVSPAWGQAELSWIVSRLAPSVVIAADEDRARWREAGVADARVLGRNLTNSTRPSSSPDVRRTVWPDDHPLVYLATSGSTGQPRIVPRSHGQTARAAVPVAAATESGPGRRWLAAVPYGHGSGFSNNLILPLLSGATAVLLERFDPVGAARLIDDHGVDAVLASPSVFGLLSDADLPAASLRSLRLCLSGGAALPGSVSRAWAARCGTPLRQSYGSTETGLVTVQHHACPAANCVGTPLSQSDIVILDRDDALPVGRTGQVAVRGPCVLEDYLDEPAETSATFWNGYFRTADLGQRTEDGHLHLEGRITPWINAGGNKVDALEVRRVLLRMAGVRDCSVEARPGPRGLDIVSATIILEPSAVVTRVDVTRHCRLHLAEYKIPRDLRFVEASAVDATGEDPRAMDLADRVSPYGRSRPPADSRARSRVGSIAKIGVSPARSNTS